MKKLLSVLLVFAIVLSFTACGGAGNTAKDALNKGLNAVKKFDVEGIAKYFANSEDITKENLAEVEGIEQAKAIFSTFSWKIKSCEEEGDKATATVELTCVSLAEIVSQIMSEMMSGMLSGTATEEPTEEAVLEKMTKMLKDPKAKKITETVTFTLEKIDEQWMITNPEVLISVMSAGLEGIFGDEK